MQFILEDHVLDVARRELRRGTDLIPLEPQVFDLLVYVIRNRDRVVSKDDLLQAVWGGRIVSESTLTTRINALRRALGDSGEEQRLIRTVARKGIRFVGAVVEAETAPKKHVSRADGIQAPLGSERPGLSLPDKPSIAVLPFENLSGDPEQVYFSDGLADDVVTALSKWQWFFVIARNSSFTFRGKAVDVKQVGRELGVRYVLEGSVRKSDNRVRVTCQLVDTATGVHIWAQRYDRDLTDVFAVQDEITGQIAQALNIELIDAESRRRVRERPRNAAALDLVLRARALTNPHTARGNVGEARTLLLKAVELDESTPGLFAELARTYLNEVSYAWTDDPAETVTKAVAAADRALKLDPRDAAAHLMKGVAHRFRGELDLALGAIRTALDLNPNYAHAQSHLAATLIQMGNPEDAYEEAKRAVRLNPRYALSLNFAGQACLHAGRYEEAVEWQRKALQIVSDNWVPYMHLAAALALSGKLDEARQAISDMNRVMEFASTRALRAREWPGSAHWKAQHERIYTALRSAGLPE
ncbi:MAG: winged helix-turn-helix domain-containing protein [Proteobacteria bacterium]|nr:winged helix-turn-helix domain-containing protein [Pseudomonadota bacterium]